MNADKIFHKIERAILAKEMPSIDISTTGFNHGLKTAIQVMRMHEVEIHNYIKMLLAEQSKTTRYAAIDLVMKNLRLYDVLDPIQLLKDVQKDKNDLIRDIHNISNDVEDIKIKFANEQNNLEKFKSFDNRDYF